LGLLKIQKKATAVCKSNVILKIALLCRKKIAYFVFAFAAKIDKGSIGPLAKFKLN